MQVFVSGQPYQIHFEVAFQLNQVPGPDYSTGEEVPQTIPVDAVIAIVEALDSVMVRLQVLAVVQEQGDVEIRYEPPSFFQQAVLPMRNIKMAYPVDLA